MLKPTIVENITLPNGEVGKCGYLNLTEDKQMTVLYNTKEGNDYTLSFFVKADSNKVFELFQGNEPNDVKADVTTEWSKVKFSFKANGKQIGVYIPIGEYYLYQLKLEDGKVATSWTASPGDTTVQTQSMIEQSAESITSTVERVVLEQVGEDFVEKSKVISSINQTAEEVSINANKINFNGTVTANGNFRILEDGSTEQKDGTFRGEISVESAEGTKDIGYYVELMIKKYGTSISFKNSSGDTPITPTPTHSQVSYLFLEEYTDGFTTTSTWVYGLGGNIDRNNTLDTLVFVDFETIGGTTTQKEIARYTVKDAKLKLFKIGKRDNSFFQVYTISLISDVVRTMAEIVSNKSNILSIMHGQTSTFSQDEFFSIFGGLSAKTIYSNSGIFVRNSNLRNDVSIWSDEEGGNIEIHAGYGHTNSWQMDANDGNFRLYTFRESDGAYNGISINEDSTITANDFVSSNGATLETVRKFLPINATQGTGWWIADALHIDIQNAYGDANRYGYCHTTSINIPSDFNFGIREVVWYNPNLIFVKLFGYTNQGKIREWYRVWNGSTWGSWFSTLLTSGYADTASWMNIDSITKLRGQGYIVASTESEGNHIWSVNAWSDSKLKKNINDTKVNGLDVILKIQHKEYDWKYDDLGDSVKLGYVANELKDVIPEAVISVPQDNFHGYDELYQIDMVKMIPYMTKSIQELKAEVDSLKKEIKELKGGKK